MNNAKAGETPAELSKRHYAAATNKYMLPTAIQPESLVRSETGHHVVVRLLFLMAKIAKEKGNATGDRQINNSKRGGVEGG